MDNSQDETMPREGVPKAAGHTPGPWTAYASKIRDETPSRVWNVHGGGKLVATVGYEHLDAENGPNARLIAAGPDLLAACEAAEAALSLTYNECCDEPRVGERCGECLGCLKDAALQAARLALAKAKGGQP